MLLVQMLVTLAISAAPVLAPAVAPTLGLSPEHVGRYAAAAYVAAMLMGLRSGGWVARLGALRLSQAALLACAAGALLAAAAPGLTAALGPWSVAGHTLGTAPVLLGAAVLIGSGYGLVNPAAAAVLTHHSPITSRGLFFSIKQTGVPMGVALAGLLLPWGLLLLGWQAAVVGVALLCAGWALALWPLVRRLEPPAVDLAHATATGNDDNPVDAAPMALLLLVWRTPALRRLSLTSMAYALTQQSFITFLVALLHLQLGWSLAAAAGVLAASQVASTVARIGFGWLADRWIAPSRLLAMMGLAMAASCLALAALGPGSAAAVVIAVALAGAGTAMGWNGVYFANLAAQVSRQDMARVSGATQFYTFGGGMVGPLLFGECARIGGSYSLAFALLALVPVGAGIALWRGSTGAGTVR